METVILKTYENQDITGKDALAKLLCYQFSLNFSFKVKIKQPETMP
jgi:hypothetical protein